MLIKNYAMNNDSDHHKYYIAAATTRGRPGSWALAAAHERGPECNLRCRTEVLTMCTAAESAARFATRGQFRRC